MKRRVGYLGPEGTFTHQAARMIEVDVTLVPLASSLEVISEVESGGLDAGVIPIDNSIEGPVVPSIDALLAHDVTVTGVVEVPIHFTAFRLRQAEPQPTTVIVSHPHALAQCQGYISRMGMPTRTASSTAAASAELKAGEIALSAEVCEIIYGLEPVERGIQDSTNGITRFVRVEPSGTPSAPNADATVIAIVPRQNNAGVLARISGTFFEYGHDLQGLVLRPLETTDFRYVFVFTVMASPTRQELFDCLVKLTEAGDSIAILGAFQSVPKVVTSTETRRMRPLATSAGELAAQLTPGV